MDATTMPSIHSLVNATTAAFPQFSFTQSDSFRWSPGEATIFYDPKAAHAAALLLHELSHGILKHASYSRDIILLQLERDAWEYARTTLSSQFSIPIDDDTIQSHLDTYRDWLHARSQCPSCSATGIQVKQRHYKCLACTHQWRVNEARICGLKRYHT